jgi:hypothetical protein
MMKRSLVLAASIFIAWTDLSIAFADDRPRDPRDPAPSDRDRRTSDPARRRTPDLPGSSDPARQNRPGLPAERPGGLLDTAIKRPELGFSLAYVSLVDAPGTDIHKPLDFRLEPIPGGPLYLDWYAEVKSGVAAKACYRVKNFGKGPSPGFEVEIKIPKHQNWTATVKHQGGLFVGEEHKKCSPLPSLPLGFFKIDYRVDWDDRVLEESEVGGVTPRPEHDNLVTRLIRIVE